MDDDGVISEVTPNGIPEFIEIGLKDGNVLHIYADGTHSDMDEFRFVEYQDRSNYPARRWLFHEFFAEHYPRLWKLYRLTRWWEIKRRRFINWYLNKTETRPDVLWGGFGDWDRWQGVRRYPFLRISKWRDQQWRNSR